MKHENNILKPRHEITSGEHVLEGSESIKSMSIAVAIRIPMEICAAVAGEQILGL